MSEKEKRCCSNHNEEKCDCGCEEHKEHDKECDCGCHEHDCDCCCNDDIVELTMDNGEVRKFYADGTIEYEGKYYAAFEPVDEIENEEGNVYIFEVSGDDEESVELLPLEDQELLDKVFAEFCRYFDEQDQEEE